MTSVSGHGSWPIPAPAAAVLLGPAVVTLLVGGQLLEPARGIASRWSPFQLDELLLCTLAMLAAFLLSRRGSRRTARAAAGQSPAFSSDDLALLTDLREAIGSDALDLHFQPKLNVRTGGIDSLEALVRWDHPVRGPVSPGRFVTLAEESGDIRALTRWVFQAACHASASLHRRGLGLTVYVNVSALLIADEAFVSDLLHMAPSHHGRIGIEVTETACLQQPQRALANLKRLADAGFSIAIDDYGVGLSSLTYLRQMPASELKIDMSFIRDLSESHRDPLIVRSTIDLAHALGLRVTAEGVDKPETLALLKIMGCDCVQGFQIAPAYRLDQCVAFLEAWSSPEVELPRYAADLRQFVN